MFTHILRRLLLLLIVAIVSALPMSALADATGHFVRPAELEPDIAFWRRIYTEVTTEGGLLHDPERSRRGLRGAEVPLRPVAEAALQAHRGREEEVRAHPRPPRERRRGSERRRAARAGAVAEGHAPLALRAGLRGSALPAGPGGSLPRRHRSFRRLARSHRRHLRDAWGCRASWLRLPHVESSFNTYAYSKVGAAGMWQFMRSTGRRFLRIDAVVDERLDPYRSTEAAARFLEQNYIVLGSWPLALTAYNHGPGGNASRAGAAGHERHRDHRAQVQQPHVRFRLAQLLCGVPRRAGDRRDPGEVLRPDPPQSGRHRASCWRCRSFVPASRIAAALDMDRDELRRLNPSLLPSVWNGVASRAARLRVPRAVAYRSDSGADEARAASADEAQVAETQHRVRSGETLSVIASRYGVSVARLAELNGLRRPYRIRAGQVLALPGKPAPSAGRRRAGSRRSPAAPAPTPPTGVVGTDESLRRASWRHAFQDRDAARSDRRGADGAEQHPQSQLRLRRSGAGARRIGARGAAGRSRSSGRQRRRCTVQPSRCAQ